MQFLWEVFQCVRQASPATPSTSTPHQKPRETCCFFEITMKRQNRYKYYIFFPFTKARTWLYPSGQLLTWRGRGSSIGSGTRKSSHWGKSQTMGGPWHMAVPPAVWLHDILSDIMAQHSQAGILTPLFPGWPLDWQQGHLAGTCRLEPSLRRELIRN